MISPAFHRQQRQQQQQDAANAPSTGSGDSLALGAAPDRRAQLLVQAGQLRLWALNLGASLTLLPEPIPGASLVTGGFHPSHPHRPAAAGLFPVPNPGPRQSERSWAENHRCCSLRQARGHKPRMEAKGGKAARSKMRKTWLQNLLRTADVDGASL